jgi:hypothetical protein
VNTTTKKTNGLPVLLRPAPHWKAGVVFLALAGSLSLALPVQAVAQVGSAGGKATGKEQVKILNGPEVIGRYQIALDQKIAEDKKAQVRLDSAVTTAKVAARAFAVTDSLNKVCMSFPNTYTGAFRDVANANACNTQSGYQPAKDRSDAAKAVIVTRTNELKAADAAVAKAQDDLNAAKNPPRKPE